MVAPASPSLGTLLVGAFALMLVIEGLLPFISPTRWRRVFEQAARLGDGQIRFIALCSMLAGIALLVVFLG